jgi:hypothetical protein
MDRNLTLCLFNFEENHPRCVYQITKYQIRIIYSRNTTILYYQVLYNFRLLVSATLLGHHQVLYLAYRGLYFITIVSNGRRDLVCNGQVHKTRRVVYNTMTIIMLPRQQTASPPSYLPFQ